MPHKLPSIPQTNSNIPKAIVDVLNPMREAVQTRFMGKDKLERAVTRNDLIQLGLVSESDLNKLDK